MVYNTPSGWLVVYGDRRSEKEVEKLSEDLRASLRWIVNLIQHYGLENVHEPHVRHLRGKLWEMRARDRDGIARAIYVAVQEKKIVILHAFVKKTQATPLEAIELVLKRAKELGCL